MGAEGECPGSPHLAKEVRSPSPVHRGWGSRVGDPMNERANDLERHRLAEEDRKAAEAERLKKDDYARYFYLSPPTPKLARFNTPYMNAVPPFLSALVSVSEISVKTGGKKRHPMDLFCSLLACLYKPGHSVI